MLLQHPTTGRRSPELGAGRRLKICKCGGRVASGVFSHVAKREFAMPIIGSVRNNEQDPQLTGFVVQIETYGSNSIAYLTKLDDGTWCAVSGPEFAAVFATESLANRAAQEYMTIGTAVTFWDVVPA